MRVVSVAWPFGSVCVDFSCGSPNYFSRLACIYSHRMQTPTTLNNQQVWGGQDFRYAGSTAEADVQDRTFVLRENQESRFHPSSRVGIVASDSDDLFILSLAVHRHIFLICLALPHIITSLHHTGNHPRTTPTTLLFSIVPVQDPHHRNP